MFVEFLDSESRATLELKCDFVSRPHFDYLDATVMTLRTFIYAMILCILIVPTSFALARQTDAIRAEKVAEKGDDQPSLAKLRDVVKTAFAETHDGWSSDEVVLNTELNDAFLRACQQELPKTSSATFNWTLLNMRKAGLLKIATTKRNRESVQKFSQIAEIAARLVHDRHKVSSDRMMADPELRAEFDREIKSIDPEIDLYSARKAAFQLRKQRKLKPELISRIADWGRQIQSFSCSDVRNHPNQIPAHPGIYIFRDQSGYLYIGQSEDLRQRLKEHLDVSSNFSLAKYLEGDESQKVVIEIHAFDPDSRASETMIRRAYESELISSRKPRFNIQP